MSSGRNSLYSCIRFFPHREKDNTVRGEGFTQLKSNRDEGDSGKLTPSRGDNQLLKQWREQFHPEATADHQQRARTHSSCVC